MFSRLTLVRLKYYHFFTSCEAVLIGSSWFNIYITSQRFGNIIWDFIWHKALHIYWLLILAGIFVWQNWDKPETIPDPDAKKPDDWDEEMDGEWEPPMVTNPEYKVHKSPHYYLKYIAQIFKYKT